MSREMKDSGIEWIGEIPTLWNQISLMRVLKQPITDGPHETPNYAESGIPFISVDSLGNSENIDLSVVKKYISYENYDIYNKKTNLEKGDILFSKSATIGKTAIVGDEKFMVWSPLAIIKSNPEIIDNKFLYYILNSDKYIEHVQMLGNLNTQVNVGMSVLQKSRIVLPNTLKEQQKIADYLDKKVSEIDNIINQTTLSIEEYKKYKQSLITETVTKGLNPDVEMKDSGVEWIGDIPKNWEVVKLNKLCSNIGDVDHKMPEAVDEGIPYISTKDFIDNEKIDFINAKKITKASFIEISRKIKPQINDIIFSRYATLGSVRYVTVDFDFLVSYSCAIIKPNKERIYSRFLYYYLKSDIIEQEINRYLNSNTQSNVGIETIKNFKILIMSSDGQKEIADYLDIKCNEIDTLITQKEQLLKELESYKKSLIYECVTGKREVS